MTQPNAPKPHPEQPQMTPNEMAMEMVNQLTTLNVQIAAQIKLQEQQLALTDELNGRLEVISRACELVSEMKAEGKIKIGFAEFAEAVAEADREIMGDDEEEEDEDEGDIPSRR